MSYMILDIEQKDPRRIHPPSLITIQPILLYMINIYRKNSRLLTDTLPLPL